MKSWPFQVVAGNHNKAMVAVQYKGSPRVFSPEEITSMILMRLKEIAEKSGLGSVSDVVISVPTFFDDAQRQATKDAAKLAGFKVSRLFNESSAVAFAYGFHKKALMLENDVENQVQRNIMVFYLGSGCLDVSILSVENDWNKYQVKGVAGDTQLGEMDFDQSVVSYCLDSIKRRTKEEIENTDIRMRRLLDACEQLNRDLGTNATGEVNLDSFYPDKTSFKCTMNRRTFEDLNKKLFDRCEDAVKECLYVSKLTEYKVDEVILAEYKVDEVILAGSSSAQVMKIQGILQETLKGNKICVGINPDTAVVQGAAIQVAILSGYGTIGKFNKFSVSEVTPFRLALGTEMSTTLISRNSKIPVAHTSPDFTASINHESGCSIDIHQIEYEGVDTKDYRRLGKFDLHIVPPPTSGAVVELRLRFSVDTDRIFKIKYVKDKHSIHKVICGRNTERFTEQEMDEMVRNADEIKTAGNLAKKQKDLKRWLTLIVNEFGPEQVDRGFCKDLDSDAKKKIQEVANWVLAGRNQLLEVEEYDSKIHDIVEALPDQFELFQKVGYKCILKANVTDFLDCIQRNADHFDPVLLGELMGYSEEALKWVDSDQLLSVEEYSDRLSEFLEKFKSAEFGMELRKSCFAN